MRYFPAFFDLKDRVVFVVGDEELAVRKLRLLRKANPALHVFSASKQGPVVKAFGGAVTLRNAPLLAADFDLRPALVIAASEDAHTNRRAAELSRLNGVPVNVVDSPELCDVVVPSIIERGDLAIGVSTGGRAPVLGRRLRERIEGLLPARLGELIHFAGARRSAVADTIAPAGRRRFWEQLFDGPVAEAVFDGDMLAAEAGFEAALGTASSRGTVHIVGAGPGDPELLTLKALRLVQEADVVLYDNLVSDAVLELIRRDAERRYVGKRKGDHSMAQEDIGALMVSLARAGKRVVRLKGGDPFVFGRGGEEVDAVRAAGLKASVVPGITAAAGCAATASVPLTHRGLSQAVTYVTAQAGGGGAPDINWAALAQLGQTIVVYMGVGKAQDVSEALVRGGMTPETPAAIIENGTLPQQRIISTRVKTLGTAVEDAGVVGPAVLVIGSVAAKADGVGLVDLINQEMAA